MLVLTEAAADAFSRTIGAAELAMAEINERLWHGKGVGMIPSLVQHHHHLQLPHAHQYHQRSLPTMQHGVISISPVIGDRAHTKVVVVVEEVTEVIPVARVQDKTLEILLSTPDH